MRSLLSLLQGLGYLERDGHASARQRQQQKDRRGWHKRRVSRSAIDPLKRGLGMVFALHSRDCFRSRQMLQFRRDDLVEFAQRTADEDLSDRRRQERCDRNDSEAWPRPIYGHRVRDDHLVNRLVAQLVLGLAHKQAMRRNNRDPSTGARLEQRVDGARDRRARGNHVIDDQTESVAHGTDDASHMCLGPADAPLMQDDD